MPTSIRSNSLESIAGIPAQATEQAFIGIGVPPYAEEITTERQDLLQDELKKFEVKIAPVEAKERPKQETATSEQTFGAEQQNDIKNHPLLANKAYFSGMDQNIHVLPPNSPEAQEAYRQLQNELSFQMRMRKQQEASMRPGG